MATVKDYVGRKSDMLAFQGFAPMRGRDQLLVQELVRAHDGGSLTTGIQKLVQRVLLILLTPMGSRKYRPLEGTMFMVDSRIGLWRTVADVQQSFYAAKLQVARQCQAVELTTDPADERYGTITLDGVTLTGDKVAIRVTVTSLAGNNFTFITPIQVPIR